MPCFENLSVYFIRQNYMHKFNFWREAPHLLFFLKMSVHGSLSKYHEQMLRSDNIQKIQGVCF